MFFVHNVLILILDLSVSLTLKYCSFSTNKTSCVLVADDALGIIPLPLGVLGS
jgi:hypothetical protein